MKMNEIKQLSAYGDNLLENITQEVMQYVTDKYTKKIKIIGAPTGVGKTHMLFRNLTPTLYKEKNARVIFYVAPQGQLIRKGACKEHIINLSKDFDITIWDGYNISMSELNFYLTKRKAGEIVFVTMTDSNYNNSQPQIDQMITDFNLENRVVFYLDEAHYGSVSEAKYMRETLGNPEQKDYNAVKYNNVVDLLHKATFFGITATRTIEMTTDYGSDEYQPVNIYPEKDKLLLRTSSYKPVYWYDPNEDIDDIIMKYFENIVSAQRELDNEADSNNLPDEVRVKLTGCIKLETSYKDKEKNDVKHIRRLFEDNKNQIPNHHNFEVATTTSRDGIKVYSFKNGSVTKIENDKYKTDDDLIHYLGDKTSKLKILIVVNKATMGTDVHNLNYGLVLRTPGTKRKDGTPVTLMGQQFNGRFTRPTIPIEKLSKYFTDKDKFIRYYLMVNSYEMWLPETDYWKKMMNESSKNLNSIHEVHNFLTKNKK